MTQSPTASFTAFAGNQKVATGALRDIAAPLKALVDTTPDAQILIFDDISGAQVDMNLHGSLEQVLQRLPKLAPALAPAPAAGTATQADQPAPAAPRGAGRPKLGVVGREVTLLPRHWEWLNSQPGGASVALRKLVEHAQRDNREADLQRRARDASYQFMTAMAGDRNDFEEACRALYAGDATEFNRNIASWPADVRAQAWAMASRSFHGVAKSNLEE